MMAPDNNKLFGSAKTTVGSECNSKERIAHKRSRARGATRCPTDICPVAPPRIASMSAVGRPSRRRRFVVNARALPASPKTRLALDGRSDNLNPPLPTPDRVPSFAACVETRDHTCACSLKAIGAKTTAHVPFFHPPLPGSERVVLNSCVVVMASSLRAAPETRGRERVTPDASSCDRLERVIM